MNHTKEPWDAQNKGVLGERTARHEIVQGCNLDSNNLPKIVRMPDLSDRSYANAARIVACVNGCAGINPEAVPELLATLKAVLALYKVDDPVDLETEKDLYDRGVNAIALAEKEVSE